MLTIFFASCWRVDARHLADETLDRVIRQIGDEKKQVDNPEAYCRGVARNVLLESLRDPRTERSVSSETLTPEQLPATPSNQELQEAEARIEAEATRHDSYLKCLRRCLQKLLQPEQAMVIKYYEGSKEGEQKENRQKLAEELDIDIRDLRNKMVRRRKRLGKCVTDCVQGPQPV